MTHDEEVQLAKDLRAYFKGEEEAYQAKGSSPIPLALVTEGAKPEEVRAARGGTSNGCLASERLN